MHDPIEYDKVYRICNMTNEMHDSVTCIYESLSDGDIKSFSKNVKQLKTLIDLLVDSVNEQEEIRSS